MAHSPQNPTPETWSGATRLFVSALLIGHLSVVVIAPWSGPPPSSELSQQCAALVLPYMKFMSLDNGYRFFAPDPGPSNLLRYELLRDGDIVASGVFPDRNAHFPRLLYHRYFMVAESMASQLPPPMSAEERAQLPPPDQERYRQAIQQARLLQTSIARNLLQHYPDADSARLYLRTHLIPPPRDILLGKTLNDPAYYQEYLMGEFAREALLP